MTENNWETENVWQWLENDELYYKIFQLFLNDSSNKKVARFLRDFVTENLIDSGSFGDLTSVNQLKVVDWMAIVEGNRID
jgi:hypothetical protein